MYLEYYGLREMPFHVTPNPRFLYLSPTHEEALQHLRYGIRERKGFIVLTGEVGCGKTTLCRKLLAELDEDDAIDTALIVNPRLSETQLLREVLKELGEEPRARAKADLLSELNDLLFERIQAGREIVLFIDEAQNMNFETMELLRLVSNFETDDQKLLQIVLMGQPELRAKLNLPELRQLQQRVLVYYDLKPLGRDEVFTYVQHRLTLAGSMGRPRFTKRALGKLFKASKGIPRLVNNLADKALLAAFIRKSDIITWWDMRRAVADIQRISS